MGDQDKSFAQDKSFVAKRVEKLRRWSKGKMKLPFGVPMVWREGKDHVADCYF